MLAALIESLEESSKSMEDKMEKIFQKFVKPNEGCLIRNPRTKTIMPKDGMNVPIVGSEGRHWRKKIRTGEVIVIEPVKVKPEASSDKQSKPQGKEKR